MSDITLTLNEDEAKLIYTLVADLPNKSNTFPLKMKLEAQLNQQLAPNQAAPEAPAEVAEAA